MASMTTAPPRLPWGTTLIAAALASALSPALLPAAAVLAESEISPRANRAGVSLTGPRSGLPKDWIGSRAISDGTAILVMPGHADSQGFGGGASGAAVALRGARPMAPPISDELFWNLLTVEAVVRLGLSRGLNIRSYDPGIRRIANGNDPRTTWSVGKAHVRAGGYAMEIHYDAHGSVGVGSGLIPPIGVTPSQIDESLAAEFGAFPRWFRAGLGAPKRGIAILEIGKLEGVLETSLRNPQTRQQTLALIAERVVSALERGLSRTVTPFSPQPDVVGSVPAESDPPTSSAGE
jgi:hypothetical protein